MPNTKSVAHFLLVDFGGGFFLLLVVTGGKQSQLLVQLTWTVLSDCTGVLGIFHEACAPFIPPWQKMIIFSRVVGDQKKFFYVFFHVLSHMEHFCFCCRKIYYAHGGGYPLKLAGDV